jgi:hypothetical protein
MSADRNNQGKSFQVLKFKQSSQRVLNKIINVSQSVTVQNGGTLLLQHGSSDGAEANRMYGSYNNGTTTDFYKIDPGDAANTVLTGQAAFKTTAIALHPHTGEIFYVGSQVSGGLYRVGKWNPETNSNTILPNGSSFKPSGKLAFHPDGTLFGVKYNNPAKLYTVDTNTGVWSLHSTLNFSLGTGGDMAFTADGLLLYSVGGDYPKLKVTDMMTMNVTKLGNVGPEIVRGLAFGANGNLYYVSDDGDVGIADVTSGNGTIIGATGVGAINDFAPVIASSELVYANISLQILPGAISQDEDMSLEMETTELSGGVAVTFGPHGTIFSVPAILNIEAHGVDFTGIDPNSVDVYYDNQETGQWELMARDDVIVDSVNGTVQVINAQLPHFSRYAIGGGA